MKKMRLIKCLFGALMLLCTVCLMSCSKDSDGINTPEIPQEEDRYYVKYEMQVSPWTSQAVWSTTISCLGDKGAINMELKERKWEVTYGPIRKDSHLYLHVNCSLSPASNADSYARIWVSKNKEPFVLKAEDRGQKSSLHATCDIDF